MPATAATHDGPVARYRFFGVRGLGFDGRDTLVQTIENKTHMPLYKFTCTQCDWKNTKETDDPQSVKCKPCNRLGLTSQLTWKKKRSDAKKRDKNLDLDDSGLHTRPRRTSIPTEKRRDLEDAQSRKRKREDEDEAESDDEEVAAMDADDTEYVPAPEFNPALRFSGGGTFAIIRVFHGKSHTITTPWTGVTAPAGRSSTNAQFGGQSAANHFLANQTLIPAITLWKSPTGVNFEWCHIIADSLGGPTVAANLFCGTFHCNTAMLCIENILRGKTHLEVQIAVEICTTTYIGLLVTYRVRKKKSGQDKKRLNAVFEKQIDALATGCTAQDGTELSGDLKKWLRGGT